MDADARLDAVNDENDRLREELERLKAFLGFNFIPPIEWLLTPSEARVFGHLLAREHGTKDSIMAALYRDFGKEEPEMKIIDVFVCKMRRKLKPWGFVIETLWGRGYKLDEESKARYRAIWSPEARMTLLGDGATSRPLTDLNAVPGMT